MNPPPRIPKRAMRVMGEAVDDSGVVHYKTQAFRVHDVAVNIPTEDFVRLVRVNLETIARERPDLLDKFGIRLEGE
jgi:hypothetical protein